MDTQIWLKKALPGKKMNRPDWTRSIHGNVATDGYRLHRDTTAVYTGSDTVSGYLDMAMKECQNNNILVSVRKDDLIPVCKRALAIGHGFRDKNYIPVLHLSFNGRLEYEAENEEVGKTYGYIECQHTGNDLTLGINPEFLKDALSGMGEEVYISLKAADRPIFITDGKRDAVIMPMRLM